jgi:hypothetical protein
MAWYNGKAVNGVDFDVELEDIGDTWMLDGIIISDGVHALECRLPFGNDIPDYPIFEPTIAQWEAWLKQSDHPTEKLYVQNNPNGLLKAIIRKGERQVDQAIIWKVYKRDNYTCRYCGKDGIPMTVDHYHPQTLGGQTTMDNLRTSCRKCNKLKAHATIPEWKVISEKKGLNAAETAQP